MVEPSAFTDWIFFVKEEKTEMIAIFLVWTAGKMRSSFAGIVKIVYKTGIWGVRQESGAWFWMYKIWISLVNILMHFSQFSHSALNFPALQESKMDLRDHLVSGCSEIALSYLSFYFVEDQRRIKSYPKWNKLAIELRCKLGSVGFQLSNFMLRVF